jgi:hypothetical protein
MAFVECKRCGYRWDATNARKSVELCSSCRARPARTVISAELGKCKPWRGLFDADEVTPVDDEGLPFMQGVRSCGKSDCVNPYHVEELW